MYKYNVSMLLILTLILVAYTHTLELFPFANSSAHLRAPWCNQFEISMPAVHPENSDVYTSPRFF